MLYAVIDVETTGGSPKDSKITEIAIFKTDGIQILDEFITLVHPEQIIPDFIVRLTGISNQMVENAPKFYEIAKDIYEFTKDCIFVAHNVSFDYGMMRSEFRKLGFDYRLPQICTVSTSRKLMPGYKSYSLGSFCKEIGIEIKERHRAKGDAEATTELFQRLYLKSKKDLKSFIKFEINPKVINSNFDLDSLEEIPNKTGIYKFINEYNQIIYIGKSIHIKSRIEQHLRNNKSAKALKMIQEIARVEYIITGSELIAMLLESQLIKKHTPLFNRQLRKSIFPYGLYDSINEFGYIELNIIKIDSINSLPIQYFNTKKEAQDYLLYVSEKYKLCQKLCSIYKTNSNCFQYTIKMCHGACINEEHKDEYNLRVQTFIDDYCIDNNSFIIIDKGRKKHEKSLVLIENGHYKGYGFVPFHLNGEKDPHKLKKYIDLSKEDKDSRIIVKSYLKNEKFQKIIEL